MNNGVPKASSVEDSIMNKQQIDVVPEGSPLDTLLKIGVVSFGVGLTFGGFAFGLGRTRKSSHFSLAAIEGHESPSRLAWRAFGWGSLIAVTSVCGPVLVIAYYSGASNPKEFGDKIKNFGYKIKKLLGTEI